MTATEFKTRLANGDKLAVVMFALWELDSPEGWNATGSVDVNSRRRNKYESEASHILAALARAEADKGTRVGRLERLKYEERNDSAEAKRI